MRPKRKFILAFGNDALPAKLLYDNFVTIFEDVTLITSSDDYFAKFLSLASGDQVVIFSISDKSKELQGLTKYIKSKKAKIAVIVNHPSSPLSEYADFLLEARSETPSFIDSYASTLGIVNALTLEIVQKDRKRVTARYKQIEKINDERLAMEMILLAPTGRAARRIMESTNFKAQTIHKFLKWDKETDTFQINKYNKSNAKIVLIDESSMIDIFLFNSLLEGLTDSVRIIMVGDANQLPSVLPGQILKDLIDSDIVPVVKLNELYRQKEDSYIINLATEINKGILDDDFTEKRSDYNFIETNESYQKNHHPARRS
jgi:hypothetical protein